MPAERRAFAISGDYAGEPASRRGRGASVASRHRSRGSGPVAITARLHPTHSAPNAQCVDVVTTSPGKASLTVGPDHLSQQPLHSRRADGGADIAERLPHHAWDAREYAAC